MPASANRYFLAQAFHLYEIVACAVTAEITFHDICTPLSAFLPKTEGYKVQLSEKCTWHSLPLAKGRALQFP